MEVSRIRPPPGEPVQLTTLKQSTGVRAAPTERKLVNEAIKGSTNGPIKASIAPDNGDNTTRFNTSVVPSGGGGGEVGGAKSLSLASSNPRKLDLNASARQKSSNAGGPAINCTSDSKLSIKAKQQQQQQQRQPPQPRVMPALASLNSKTFLQAGQVTESLVNARRTLHQTREFNVTHTSDNWKLRKAARRAEGDGTDSATTASLLNVPTKPIPGRKILNRFLNKFTKAKKAGEMTGKGLAPVKETSAAMGDRLAQTLGAPTKQRTSLGDLLHKLREREKTLLSGVPEPPPHQPPAGVAVTGGFISGGVFYNKNHFKVYDEGFMDGDSDDEKGDEHEDDQSSGFSEAITKQKALPTEDFDTDFSDSDAESTDSEKLRTRNKTLQTYMTACSKCDLTPNATFMRQCGQGASIDLRNRMLTYRDAKPIAIALVNDRKTSFLDISDNPLGPLGTSYIAEMMSENRTIMELNLSNTDPGTGGLSALAETLPNNKHLRRLHLDDNEILEGDGRHLAKIITLVPDLREVTLNHATLGFKDGVRVALALASDVGTVSSLSLRYNKLRMESAVQIALSLQKNTGLKELNLAWNGFGVDGCRALAQSLKDNTTLRELDLTCNRLGIKSLEHLVQVLKVNKGLSKIRLCSNPLTTEGAKAIIVAVTEAKDSFIEEIDLRGIPVDKDFTELVKQLRDSRAIKVLYDSTVHMGTTDITKEFDALNVDRFDPIMVLFEYMKKDNLRVIDLFQFLDQKKRDKLSKKDLRDGVNALRIPFTEHNLDVIMKTLDANRDGFLVLDDMVKGYKDNDRIVKQRRIKANWRRKPDRGLEDLWAIIKEIIAKRKDENEKRSQAEQEEMRKNDSRRMSLKPGDDTGFRRKSLKPGEDGGLRRKSLKPIEDNEQQKKGSRRQSLKPAGDARPKKSGSRRKSMKPV